MQSIDQLEILLVEDNEIHRDILEKKIKKLGVKQVVAIATFKDACSYLKRHDPDIVFSDYYLDIGITGDDLVDACLVNKNIPVILMSSFFDSDNLSSFEKNPLVGYLQKNASESEIRNAIEQGLENKKKFVNGEKIDKINDYIYVKHEADVMKLALADIEYISVDGRLLLLHVGHNTFMIRSSLSDFKKRLPENFLKIHQTYIINLKFLVSIQLEDSVVKLANISLPFSRDCKKNLLSAYYVA
jgi:DNA-binding LytR/AlgR family response regulator